MTLVLAPFWWALRRLVRAFARKGFVGVVLLATFLNLDQLFPALGGKLTTAAFVLGPALMMGAYARFLARWDGGPNQFAALSLYMGACGFMGLLRAWSAAAGSDMPGFVASFARWIFGPFINLVAGGFSAFFGYERYAPMPVLHPEGLVAQVSELDPLLTIVSLGVIVWASSILASTVRQWGGGAPPLRPEDRAKARNRLVSPMRAGLKTLGIRRDLTRRIVPLVGGRRLSPDEFVIGITPHWIWRPWTAPMVLAGRIMILLGLRPEGTIFDPRPIIAASYETGVLIVGGAGAGKTLIQEANMICGTGPYLFIETQGNAGEKDKPLIEGDGRSIFVVAPELGMASASFNPLDRFDPGADSFAADVERLAGYVIEVRGEHITLRRCAFELVAAVIANVVLLARMQGHTPTLMQVYECLSDPDLGAYLSDWTIEGHPTFRRWCATLAARVADPEFANSLAAMWSPELSFLADKAKAAVICGGTEQVFDPAWLLEDPDLNVVLQINQQDLAGSGALLRLLMIGVMAPRIALNRAQAKRTRARGLTLYIDELAALGGSQILDDTVQFYRQKGVRWIYSMQNPKQADALHGQGTFSKWSAAADIRLFAKPGGEVEIAEHVSKELGETVRLVRTKMFSGERGFATNGADWQSGPLLSPEQLAALKGFKVIALVRVGGRGMVKILCDNPAWFRHPALRAYHRRALRRHGGLIARPWETWRDGLLPEPDAPILLPRRPDDAPDLFAPESPGDA